jgi:hypothetical protein
MIVSNEPGYYKSNEFGIRIENLLAVVPTDMPAAATAAQDKAPSYFLRFQRLTLVPIQRELIDVDMLTAEEIDWVDTYHSEVSRKRGLRWSSWRGLVLTAAYLSSCCTDPSGAASEAVGESTRLAAEDDRTVGLICSRPTAGGAGVHRTIVLGDSVMLCSDAPACPRRSCVSGNGNSALDERGSGHGYACSSADSCLFPPSNSASVPWPRPNFSESKYARSPIWCLSVFIRQRRCARRRCQQEYDRATRLSHVQ